jgi:hypothetical protein
VDGVGGSERRDELFAFHLQAAVAPFDRRTQKPPQPRGKRVHLVSRFGHRLQFAPHHLPPEQRQVVQVLLPLQGSLDHLLGGSRGAFFGLARGCREPDHHGRARLGLDDHVVGIQRAVHDSLAVRRCHCPPDLEEHPLRPFGRQGPVAPQQVAERIAPHVAHHQRRLAVVQPAHLAYVHRRGVPQPGLRLCPAHEAVGGGPAPAKSRLQHLDRDVPSEHVVARAVHHGRRAPADLLQHRVVRLQRAEHPGCT